MPRPMPLDAPVIIAVCGLFFIMRFFLGFRIRYRSTAHGDFGRIRIRQRAAGTEIGSQLRRGRSVSIVGVRHRCGAGSIPEPRGGLIQTSVISTSTLPRIALEQMPCLSGCRICGTLTK